MESTNEVLRKTVRDLLFDFDMIYFFMTLS